MPYKIFNISDGISLIQETYVANFMRCNIWHIKGEKFDLLIDTGMGLSSLKSWVLKETDKPIKAIITHSHFDHSGSLHEFDCRLGHREEADIMASENLESKVFTGSWKEIEIIDRKLFPKYEAKKYYIKPAPLTGYLDEGDILDLGNRVFKVMHLPGHSPGSIGLWDPKSKEIFTGDALYDGELLDNFYHSNPDIYYRTLSRLKTLDINIFHGGHFPSFGKVKANQIIDKYISGNNKFDILEWFKRNKKIKKSMFTDQNWEQAKSLISKYEIKIDIS